MVVVPVATAIQWALEEQVCLPPSPFSQLPTTAHSGLMHNSKASFPRPTSVTTGAFCGSPSPFAVPLELERGSVFLPRPNRWKADVTTALSTFK